MKPPGESGKQPPAKSGKQPPARLGKQLAEATDVDCQIRKSLGEANCQIRKPLGEANCQIRKPLGEANCQIRKPLGEANCQIRKLPTTLTPHQSAINDSISSLRDFISTKLTIHERATALSTILVWSALACAIGEATTICKCLM